MIFPYTNTIAWYDYELTQYQKERQEGTELEKTFEERKVHMKQQEGVKLSEHMKSKIQKQQDTEWQRAVKTKKNEEYYNKLAELESEQVTKETKLREASHQMQIPGDKIVTVAKGMAQKYENTM